MFRAVSPVGHPLSWSDVPALFRKDPDGTGFLSRYYPAGSVFPVSSGTAALYVSLQTLKRASARDEVVLPAYSCPSLVAAVVKSGLKPVLCDMHPARPLLDLEQLATVAGARTLAVVAVHLFGVPENVPEIRRLAGREGFFVLEDAAQAFGNRSATSGGWFGSLGDLGVISFGRGKPLSLLHGGAVIANRPGLKPDVEAIHAALPRPQRSGFLPRHALLLLLYTLFFHPRTHWLPRSLPFLKLGETHYRDAFFVGRIGPGVLRFGDRVHERYQGIRQVRKALAHRYAEMLEPYAAGLAFLPPPFDGEDDIALLRFPIVVREAAARDRVLSALLRKGLGGSGSYPVPLNELEGASSRVAAPRAGFPNARAIAARILTLPLHCHVRERDLEDMDRIFARAL